MARWWRFEPLGGLYCNIGCFLLHNPDVCGVVVEGRTKYVTRATLLGDRDLLRIGAPDLMTRDTYSIVLRKLTYSGGVVLPALAALLIFLVRLGPRLWFLVLQAS